jgi:hypothetical protein
VCFGLLVGSGDRAWRRGSCLLSGNARGGGQAAAGSARILASALM